MLRLAAREASIIGVLPGEDGPEGLGKQMAIIRQAAGARYDSIEFTRLHFDVQVDGKPERANPGRGPSLVGSTNEVVEQLQRLREEHDISYIMVIGPQIEAFAPVVAKLAGT
jgi:alkanesulfonate monooxygenase SsuD/methylene tetrahydromethanopterin reductase-like flavin-dependent oxidoreductase (luciferase family)